MFKTFSIEIAGRTLSVDIGRVSAQANGAAFMHYGDTTVLSTATARMTSGLEKAVGALLGVLEDQSASPGLRVQAANSLLSHCAKYIETNTIMRRLDALENEMRERENENGKV